MIDLHNEARVTSINVSKGGIPKFPVSSSLILKGGLQGDGHNHAKHYRPEQAVSLQDVETLQQLNREGYALAAGATGENVNVRRVNINALAVGSILEFSGGVMIEITRKRPPCYVLDAIDPQLKNDILGRCGAYAKVLREGVLAVGETITVKEPVLHDMAAIDH
jgi:MOSC domain-containing protein YiiM